jgi:hypothetical protein
MGGEKQNAFAASVSALEVFKTIIDDDAGDIFAGVAGEEADFGKLPSEGDEFAANQVTALARRHLGEGDSQVAHGNAAQAAVKQVHYQPERDPFGPRQGAREQADGLNPQPDDCVFETLAHCAGV